MASSPPPREESTGSSKKSRGSASAPSSLPSSVPSSAQARHERTRERALRDLKSLRYEGGGFGAGWTQSALVRSLLRTNREATDITPRLRRVIIFLRVLSFVLMSLWVIYYLANR